MTLVIVDPQTLTRLSQAEEDLDLVDPSGNVIGHFVPARMEPTISEEELDRREKLGGGRALTGILADLEKRA